VIFVVVNGSFGGGGGAGFCDCACGGYVFCGFSSMSLLLMGFLKYMDVRRCSLFRELCYVFSRW